MKKYLLAGLILFLILLATVTTTLAAVFAVQITNKDQEAARLRDRVAELEEELDLTPTVAPTTSPTGSTTPTPSSPVGSCYNASEDERIIVFKPCVNEVVAGEAQIKGVATGLFEGTMIVEVLDADRNLVVEKVYTLAGEPGASVLFDKTFSFTTPASARGFMKFYAESAMDGSAIHVVEVPVRFTP